jgi:DNA-binding response OmpR family regulator
MRFLLRTFLEMRGMRVVEAEDGEAGVRVAEELRPDLILMDWSLPRMDGITATILIRKRNTSHHIPIVLLSGHAAPTLQKATREAGYCEYLVKPFDLDQLDHVLRKHLLLRVISAPAESPCEFHRGVL